MTLPTDPLTPYPDSLTEEEYLGKMRAEWARPRAYVRRPHWFRDRIDPDPVLAFLDGMIAALILVLVAAFIVQMVPAWL